MNQDSVGISQTNDMICEFKTYATDKTWLTVLPPADPLTGSFQLQVTTNDYLLAGTYMVNMVVGFVTPAFTQTITETFTVTLLHPCKTTLLTTSQTVGPLSYTFGDPVLTYLFAAFDDSVATQYGVAGLCAPVFSLA